MTTCEPVRHDARHCPRCDAHGILPLDQPRNEGGAIVDPVMICPVCRDEFRAEGVTWLGAVPPPNIAEASNEELEEWAGQAAAMLRDRANEGEEPVGAS